MLPSVLFMFTTTTSPGDPQASTARSTAATAGSGGTRSTPTEAGAGSVRT